MRVYLEDAEELAERQIKVLRREFEKSGTATIEVVRRLHVPGVELRYELLIGVMPGWMTATFTKPGQTRASHDANLAVTLRLLNSWVKDTTSMVGGKAPVVRCDVTPGRSVRGRPPELHLCLVARVPNAALDSLARTTRADQRGAGHVGLPDHVQSGPGGAA
ncbi:hypothetical protein [Modestobacter sp. Leaf380]|uniref:hypothetical protein n=1 Tax=Modestobacter sp. Leaf380 TaxID=1736356 RepID=UPI0006FEDA56|nr:hypothetical protein [Modestobacter sp. Leaf380]KQS66155.1 hypothetical protein ASG41_12465 [Modestobacter sp. Leaf380]